MITYKNPSLKALITRNEGEELRMYRCPAGYLTIGVGHNLEANPISEAASQQILEDDLKAVCEEVQAAFPWFEEINAVRQAAVIDLVFNMGLPTFQEFKKTIAFLEGKQFVDASEELLRGSGPGGKSRYYHDVGPRADRISAMIRTGEWQS